MTFFWFSFIMLMGAAYFMHKTINNYARDAKIIANGGVLRVEGSVDRIVALERSEKAYALILEMHDDDLSKIKQKIELLDVMIASNKVVKVSIDPVLKAKVKDYFGRSKADRVIKSVRSQVQRRQ